MLRALVLATLLSSAALAAPPGPPPAGGGPGAGPAGGPGRFEQRFQHREARIREALLRGDLTVEEADFLRRRLEGRRELLDSWRDRNRQARQQHPSRSDDSDAPPPDGLD